MPAASSRSTRIDGEDDTATLLLLLRSADADNRIFARSELADLFQRRGMPELAAECYEGNIADGWRDPDQCDRLASWYRHLDGAIRAEPRVAVRQSTWEDEPADVLIGIVRAGCSQRTRAALGEVFERRGMPELAAECYERNIADGVRDHDECRRLAAIYRRLAEPVTRQTALPPRPLRMALLYLTAIGAAEVLTVLSPRLGMALHGLLLLLLLAHGSVVSNEAERAFLWGFALAPLIRLSSLSLPLLELPPLYWYPIISVPIFAATIVAARTMGYSWRHLGLTVTQRSLIAAGLLVPTGIVLGLGEYLILRPEPLSRELTLSSLWLPALVLSVLTGFEEELLFRGLLQRAATEALGGQAGLIVVSLLFAALHIGYWSLADLVFVFAVGYAFALVARWSGSVLAPTFCHAAVNVSMFAIWPFLLPTLVVSR